MNRLQQLIPLLFSIALAAYTVVSAEHMHVDASHEASCDICPMISDLAPESSTTKIENRFFLETYLVQPVSAALALVIRQFSRDPPTPI